MSPSRRVFLKSFSRSGLVLSLESVLGLANPRWLRAQSMEDEKDGPKKELSEGNDLGVSFLNVARESGLSVKTIWRRAQEQISARDHWLRGRVL